ncbi:MAG: hypothetical protein A2Y40_10310 [Candidatus Margulisbacteria bacterium GWF2_35_9]|nr:MAG: hypothetical protein A2Y40_10310 [Candidatus Margulisbacteria bacterium GWF2_35_9]
MKKVVVIVLSTLFLSCVSFGFAWFESTDLKEKRDQLKTFVNSAVDYYVANGEEAAMKAFNEKDGQFQKGDLYIFANTFEGVTLAHINEKLIGKTVIKLKDAKQSYFIEEQIKICKEKGEGWNEYYWTHPVKKAVALKITYIKRIPGKDIYVGAGLYKND